MFFSSSLSHLLLDFDVVDRSESDHLPLQCKLGISRPKFSEMFALGAPSGEENHKLLRRIKWSAGQVIKVSRWLKKLGKEYPPRLPAVWDACMVSLATALSDPASRRSAEDRPIQPALKKNWTIINSRRLLRALALRVKRFPTTLGLLN